MEKNFGWMALVAPLLVRVTWLGVFIEREIDLEFTGNVPGEQNY
jgi:hypothetical protein